MKMHRNKFLILVITLTILATISLQIHWNLKNYEENKAALIKEVQIAFDNGIENYQAEESKKLSIAFFQSDTVTDDEFMNKVLQDTVFKSQIFKEGKAGPEAKSNKKREITGHSIFIDDTKKPMKLSEIDADNITSIQVVKGKKAIDSINKFDYVNKIIINRTPDSINFKKLDTAFTKELKRKDIALYYTIEQFKGDTLHASFTNNNGHALPLITYAKESLVPSLTEQIKLSFNNPTLLLLKRSLAEICLSFLLLLATIACLMYLLYIINQQKKTDEIKNDLISNITHEFKTPITTIASALEGIRNFNDTNDPEKTKRYLTISSQQLGKLETMVEKLLETASLETDKVAVNKEPADIVKVINDAIDKHRMNAPEKTVAFTTDSESKIVAVDVFHFENAVSNLIDNAVKYGGDTITVRVETHDNSTYITIQDNGTGIDKSQRDKIFDKFYRIPKGNIHDVKGFGIGLYYAKKIIEKHNGSLELLPVAQTTFKITLADA